MKLYVLLLLLYLFYHCNLFAQKNPTIIVKSGHTIKESVPAIDLYEYPKFTPGTVFFMNGNTAAATMNYNRFLDGMQFITATGDTLRLTTEQNIKFINIGNDTFFHDQGPIKLINSTAHAKLGIKQILRIIGKEKIGAYGMSSATTAIDSYGSYYDGTRTYNLIVMQDLVLARKAHFYIGDNDNHFVLASKKNIINLFPEQQEALLNYFKKNKIVFHNKEDLEKLVQYLDHL